MADAEEETHQRVGAEIERLVREIARSRGRVFSVAGDGVMAEFPSAVDALKCALRLQADLGRRNAMQRSGAQEILFRIGLNVGELVVEGDRVGGTAVNVTARIEALCEPGGIALSEAVLNQVRRLVTAEYQFLGRPPLKNIQESIGVYQIPRAACSKWIGPRQWARPGPDPDAVEPGREYRPSLAVLPFRTLQKNDDDAYFAEGIVEDVILALGALKELVVVSRSSVQEFARLPLDLTRVAHALDVRYVLHGSVRKSPTGLRITVELDEAHSGTVIWVDRFDGALEALFELQDRIALRVARSLAPHVRQRELDRATRKPPESLTAFDLTLRALELFHGAQRDHLERAGALLRQSIAADPLYAPAHSHLAAVHMRLIGQGWSADAAADGVIAAQHAAASLERDPNDAAAMAIYGHVQSYLFRNYAVASDFLDRAMAAGPNCALAWGFSSLTRGYLGEFDKAIGHGEWALRLCPLGPDAGRFAHYLSQAYYLAGRHAEAAAWGRNAAADAPANASNLRCLIASLVALGEEEEAKYFASKLLQLTPDFRLAAFRARTPLPAHAARDFADRLKRAGMPD